MFKGVSSARTKADSDMQPIAPMSSPTIGNTNVEPNPPSSGNSSVGLLM